MTYDELTDEERESIGIYSMDEFREIFNSMTNSDFYSNADNLAAGKEFMPKVTWENLPYFYVDDEYFVIDPGSGRYISIPEKYLDDYINIFYDYFSVSH